MHIVTQFVLSISAVIAASSLFALFHQVQQIRIAMESRRMFSVHAKSRTLSALQTPGPSAAELTSGFGIFVYRGGRWHLEADLSAPGCEALAPNIAGRFEGQVIRKESTARVEDRA